MLMLISATKDLDGSSLVNFETPDESWKQMYAYGIVKVCLTGSYL